MCALAPPMPKLLTLTRSYRSFGHGVGSRGTVNFRSAKGIFGFGFENLIFGGIIRCSKARTALMSEVIPEAPSECPTCVINNEHKKPGNEERGTWVCLSNKWVAFCLH